MEKNKYLNFTLEVGVEEKILQVGIFVEGFLDPMACACECVCACA